MKHSLLLLLAATLSLNAYNQTAAEFLYTGLDKWVQDDHRGAIADYTKAIERNPEYAKAYLYRGLVKLKLGYKDRGCMDWSKAGELGYPGTYEKIRKYCN